MTPQLISLDPPLVDHSCHGRSCMTLFADDLETYNIVDTNNPTATLLLSLDQLVKWSRLSGSYTDQC